MDDCVFCKIVRAEIPSKKEFESESFIVIEDINPKAPVHLLIIPKKHTQDITTSEDDIWIDIAKIVKELAKKKGLRGFRLVHNAGEAAVVQHMHVHFLGEVRADREV